MFVNEHLACRKRRIKCGEERPTCQNCIKSKRKCEGYVQKLTFKDPLSTYRPSWAGTSEMIFSSRGGPQKTSKTALHQVPVTPPTIAPKPAGLINDASSPSSSNQSRPLQFVQEGYPSTQATTFDFQQYQPGSAEYTPSPTTSRQSTESHSPRDSPAYRHVSPPVPQNAPQHYKPSHYDFNSLTKLDKEAVQRAPGQVSRLDVASLQGGSQGSGKCKPSRLQRVILNYESIQKLTSF